MCNLVAVFTKVQFGKWETAKCHRAQTGFNGCVHSKHILTPDTDTSMHTQPTERAIHSSASSEESANCSDRTHSSINAQGKNKHSSIIQFSSRFWRMDQSQRLITEEKEHAQWGLTEYFIQNLNIVNTDSNIFKNLIPSLKKKKHFLVVYARNIE